MHAAGYVLVGGNSSRMGTDKAFLPGQFRYLTDDVAESVRSAAGSVTLIGNPLRYHQLQYACLPDLRPGLGPLSGLEAALVSSSSKLNLVLACDMPAVGVSHLRVLIERAKTSKSHCIVTKDVTGKVHPLCAVYKKECLSVIQCRLDEKRLSLMGLLGEVSTGYLDIPTVIENLNTPEDWSRWRSKERRSTDETCPILT